jgi:hypothetical protein
MATSSATSIDSGDPADAQSIFQAPATLVVALLIVLRDLCPQWKYWPNVDTLLKLTGAGRSQAYEYAKTLKQLLPRLVKRAGRPPAPAPPDPTRQAVQTAIHAYLRAHPGAVSGNGPRTVYSDGFRRFVVQLVAPGQAAEGLSAADLAEVTGVPLGTLKNWLFPPNIDNETAAEPTDTDQKPKGSVSVVDTLRDSHLRLIVTLWQTWKGPFNAFCLMLRTEHRLRYGDTYIGTFLEALGLRQRRRRTPVEAPWSSGTYRRFFAGGQWLGDGTEVSVRWGLDTFVFNLESIHDVASDATVGFAVTDVENEDAVHQAYSAALETTQGQVPYALTLDNKECNHSPGAVAATPGTILLRSTPGRGQSKAPIEGSYGLFQQTMPPLAVTATTPREQARQAAELVFTAWYRGRNGKPRARLEKKTPAEAYIGMRTTAKDIEQIESWIREQRRRQEEFQKTRDARRDPVRIELLKQGLAELGIADPEGRLAVALAYYSREAIVRGLATFRAKQELGKVPAEADSGRYLGGIIRQLDIRLELELTGKHLLAQRLRLRDLTLAPLQKAAQAVRNELSPPEQAQAFVDRSLEATIEVDSRFWMGAAADSLSAVSIDERETLYQALVRRVSASFGTDRLRRHDLIDRLAAAATSTEDHVSDPFPRHGPAQPTVRNLSIPQQRAAQPSASPPPLQPADGQFRGP